MGRLLPALPALLALLAGLGVAQAAEELFPEGKLDKPPPVAKLYGVADTTEGLLRGAEGAEALLTHMEDGGPGGAGCVKVSAPLARLAEKATHNNVGMVVIPAKAVKRVRVTFDAKWENEDGGEITLSRIWGGALPVRVKLTGDWVGQEVELEGLATGDNDFKMDGVVFSPLWNRQRKDGAFFVANIGIKEAAPQSDSRP